MITWNPNDRGSNVVLSNNNLTATGVDSTRVGRGIRATVGKHFGKWYFETTFPTQVYQLIGISDESQSVNLDTSQITPLQSCRLFETYRGLKPNSVTGWNTPYVTGNAGSNQTIGVSVDLDLGEISFYRNGVFLGVAFSDLLTMGFPLYPYGGISSNGDVIANFGATEFNIVNSNPDAWEQLTREGYQPYDVDSADWFKTTVKHLIKSNNNILTIQDNEFISVPNTTQQSFETYGLDDLFGLATPSHRTTYIMNADRLEGEGKVFSRKIDPAKWQRTIQKMQVK